MAERYICIHGHFYQPPRENPWLEEVEFQESAQPYHDWNQRITAECYAPNAVSRIMDLQGRIIGLINNYSKISFNFGPTLLHWLERHNPAVYQSILDADKESMNNFSGHGSALVQVYNHMIMPLANRRDKETQVKWAIGDFQARFGRYPEGIWLPETAVDVETLEVLAENNLKFTILAPHQAKRVRKIGSEKWVDLDHGQIDSRRVYLCKLPSGKSVNLFFYDNRTASDIAFGNLLESGEAFAKRLIDSFKDSSDGQLIENIASDGELYGHHHPHGDMTLAYCLYYIDANKLAKITNYAEFLEKNPPQYEVEIQENTSWSCMHGIERWRSDCGDNSGRRKGWNQAWRKPLRDAMDWLRDTLSVRFEQEASQYLKDPWGARNAYISVLLDRSRENVEAYLSAQAKRELSEDEKRRVVKLLELQRYAILMYTSCGWFFDEISGIETVQVMMYAARAMQLARTLFGLGLEEEYAKIIEKAPSNVPEFGNGAQIYFTFIKPAIVDFAKISAQNTIIELFSDEIKTGILTSHLPECCFKISLSEVERRDDGRFRLIVNRSKVYSVTTSDEETFGCAAIWLGDHNVSCGAMRDMPQDTFSSLRSEVLGNFEKGQINEIIVNLTKYFEANTYSLKDMFKDDQRYILDYILVDGLKKAKELYDIIYRDNSALLRFMKEARIPSPRPLQSAAEVVLNMEMERLLPVEDLNLEELQKVILNSKNLSIALDSELLALEASERTSREFQKLMSAPENIEHIQYISKLLKIIRELPINLDLWQSQNIAFKIAEKLYREIKNKKDGLSKSWVLAFTELCELIGIRLD